jgi:predicted nucleic acid-binding protein
MRLAYVDACVWITLIEGFADYRPPIRAALAALAQDGWVLCTSDAVRLEVMVRPLRLNDTDLAGIYRALLAPGRSLSVAPEVFAEALTLAVNEGLKAMDAVHVAVAVRHGCGRFVTTDPHFRALTAITPLLIGLSNG